MTSTAARALAAALGMLAGAAAYGQTPAAFENVEVALWPEYDREAVLTIYRIDLAPTTTLPARVELTIPTAAGSPNAVAQMSGGNLVTIPYQRSVEGTVARLSFEATQRLIQVEYYDPGIRIDGTRREYTFRWPAPFAVESLSVAVQEPLGSSAFSLSPPPSETTRGAEGLLYDWVRFGPVAAGQETMVSFGYDKTEDSLTADLLPPSRSPEPAASQSSSSESGSPSIALGLLVLGVVLLGAAAAVGLQTLRRRGQLGRAGSADRGAAFCTRCGAPASGEDRFCGKCGHRHTTTR